MQFVELPRLSNRFDDSQTSVLTGLGLVGGWSYICHDDIFVMRPVEWVGPCVRGGLPVLPTTQSRNPYYKRGNAARIWLNRQGVSRPLNYNVHVPFLCRSEEYLRVAAWAEEDGLPAGYRASLYANLKGLPARKVPDPKVISNGVTPNARTACWSMSNGAWDHGIAGKMVRRQLPEPAPWELMSRSQGEVGAST